MNIDISMLISDTFSENGEHIIDIFVVQKCIYEIVNKYMGVSSHHIKHYVIKTLRIKYGTKIESKTQPRS